MKRLIGFLMVTLWLGAVAFAQDNPKAEITGDYSYFRANPGLPSYFNSQNLNGGGGQATFYMTKWLGFAADLQGYGSYTQCTKPGAPVSGCAIFLPTCLVRRSSTAQESWNLSPKYFSAEHTAISTRMAALTSEFAAPSHPATTLFRWPSAVALTSRLAPSSPSASSTPIMTSPASATISPAATTAKATSASRPVCNSGSNPHSWYLAHARSQDLGSNPPLPESCCNER